MKEYDALEEQHLLTSPLHEGERSVPRPLDALSSGTDSAVRTEQETGWAPQPVYAFGRNTSCRRESNRDSSAVQPTA
jgi:hypothetical protein